MSERAWRASGAAAPELPFRCEAVLFDMDGVVTDTAGAHAAAWKQLFDDDLRQRAEAEGTDFVPFDADADYRAHVDGKPRYDGVRDFLAARDIVLPWGDPADAPEEETVCGLGNRKDRLFNDWLAANRVPAFPGTLAVIGDLEAAGIGVAVFSASRNAEAVLKSAGVLDLFEVRVDGRDAARQGLPGKPDPAVLLEAARRLGADPKRTAVVEDAEAGVEAGRRGGFGLVVGIERTGTDGALLARGAHLVLHDVAALALDPERRLIVKTVDTLPSLWAHEEALRARLRAAHPAVFLDYDGTLTPIVEDPAQAIIDEAMRETVASLARALPVAIVSGRDIPLLRRLIRLDEVVYAGSHGFEIAGPGGLQETIGVEYLDELDAAEADATEALAGIAGAAVERKRFDVSVHYRRVAASEVEAVEQAVAAIVARHPRLRRQHGKKVLQIQPRLDWNKGRAVLWVLERLGLDGNDVLPLYIGDDVTDEDAFCALAGRGLNIVVRGDDRPTAADLALEDPGDVRRFLESLIMPDRESCG